MPDSPTPAHDELDVPEISTYNSFANVLYRDNATVLGRESDGTVLGEAAAWQLARTIVTQERRRAHARAGPHASTRSPRPC